MAPFWPQNFKTKLFLKKQIQLSKPDALIFCMTWKTLFWAHFGFLLAHKPQIKIFPKKLFQSILSFMLLLLYEKKSEKLWASIFHKPWKISLWAYFGPHFAWKPYNKIFPKRITQVYFKTLRCFNFKQEVSKTCFWSKNPRTKFFKKQVQHDIRSLIEKAKGLFN